MGGATTSTNLAVGGVGDNSSQQPQYASNATKYASTASGVANPAGFIPPTGGYGVPTNTLQQVQQTQPPATLAPANISTTGLTQQAGYTPVSLHPNYNMQMGATTGYKNPTMK